MNLKVFAPMRSAANLVRRLTLAHVHLSAGCLSQLDVARFAKRYPAVMTALLRSLMEVTVKYYKALLG